MALKVSTGPFFQKNNLQNFRLDTPTQGLPRAFQDTYESKEVESKNPEGGKPDSKIKDFMSLNKTLDNTKLKNY